MKQENLSPKDREIVQLIAQYEAAKAEDRNLYLDPDQLANIADQYALQRNFEKAQEAITYGLYLHPGNTSLLIEQAYLYLDLQQNELAQEVADSIKEDYDPKVKLLKAELLLNEEKPEAANDLLSSIDLSEINIDTLNDIIYLFSDLEYSETAWEWLDKGEAEYGEKEEFIAMKANFLATTEQFEEAVNQYNRLLDIDPYNAFYWVEMAKCCFSKGDCGKAIEACDFALAINEKYGEAYLYRGHAFFYMNNSKMAIPNYKKAMEYNSIAPKLGYMFIGLAYMNEESWEKSNSYFQKIIDLFEEEKDNRSPFLADIYTYKAKVTFELGNNKEAYELCEKAKYIFPDKADIYLTEGKLYLKDGLPEKASESFKFALKYDSGFEIQYLIGLAYTDSGMLQEAKTYYKEAFRIFPRYVDVAERLSAICLINNEIGDFLKYNAETANPIDEAGIKDLLTLIDRTEGEKEKLHKILERIKENKK